MRLCDSTNIKRSSRPTARQRFRQKAHEGFTGPKTGAAGGVSYNESKMAEQIASDTARFAKLVADNKITTD